MGGEVPAPIPIADPDDPRIAAYSHIRERDLVGRGERFIAEGEVVLAVLLRQRRFTVESLLVSDKRLAALDGAALAPDIPVYVASQPVMDRIAGFHIHRGVLAVGRRVSSPRVRELLAGLHGQALVAVAIGIANHDNMGGLFRNAAAFGADALILDATSCDPLYRKAIRVSVGATFIVPYARADAGEDILSLLADTGFAALALSPSGQRALHDITPAERTAVIFGTEGPGLPADIMARMETVRIAMQGTLDSLNVATASGIVLHHLATARRAMD
ncbi:TrmH family RNA methyltransferase [Chelatococcus sp. GCM10030263]|uniref:TrmH family RNA methyltransferase n=1 Tax=Chelatococcus sp. GCM10030263 TaxID=3273387 RepID=UPI003606EABF